jgi:N-acetylmuramoyl-L-alanine amidase
LDQLKTITDVRKPEPLFAGFKVLKAPDVPSILVEMGYITSPREERRFEDNAYRAKLAGAIAKGVQDYLEHYVHLQAPAMMKNGAGIPARDDTPKKKKSRHR